MSAGHFVLNRKVFDYLGGPGCTFEREPLEQISTDGQLSAYCHNGFFFAMDTYREFKHLNDLWAAGDAPWKVW
jgi:glucose-1-phosphate cytidylyltransferase